VRSAPRLYKEKQLRLRENLKTSIRRIGVNVTQSPASKDVNTENEEDTALEAVTRLFKYACCNDLICVPSLYVLCAENAC
jgi:hypothetical protein